MFRGSARGNRNEASFGNPFSCPTPPPPPDILVASSDEASGKSSLFTLKRRLTSSFHAPHQSPRPMTNEHHHRAHHVQSAQTTRTADHTVSAPAPSPRRQSTTSHGGRRQPATTIPASTTRLSTFSNLGRPSTTGVMTEQPTSSTPVSSSAMAAPLQAAGGGHGSTKDAGGKEDNALLYLDSTTNRLVSRLIPGREYYGGVYFAPPPTMSLDRVITAIHARDTQMVSHHGGLSLPKLFGGGHSRGTAASVVSDDSDASSLVTRKHTQPHTAAPSESPSRHPNSHNSTTHLSASAAVPVVIITQEQQTPGRSARPAPAPPGLTSWAAPVSTSQPDIGLVRPSRDFSTASVAPSGGAPSASFLEGAADIHSLETTLTAPQPLTPGGGLFRGTIASRRQLRQPTVALEEPM